MIPETFFVCWFLKGSAPLTKHNKVNGTRTGQSSVSMKRCSCHVWLDSKGSIQVSAYSSAARMAWKRPREVSLRRLWRVSVLKKYETKIWIWCCMCEHLDATAGTNSQLLEPAFPFPVVALRHKFWWIPEVSLFLTESAGWGCSFYFCSSLLIL